MDETGPAVVIGGTRGVGRRLAETPLRARQAGRPHRARRGDGPDVAEGLGPDARGLRLLLTQPATIAAALADVGPVSRLALAGVTRADMLVRAFEHREAARILGIKTVRYSEVLHVLASRLQPDDAAVLLLGGLLKDRPNPGSVLATIGNGAVAHLVAAVAHAGMCLLDNPSINGVDLVVDGGPLLT